MNKSTTTTGIAVRMHTTGAYSEIIYAYMCNDGAPYNGAEFAELDRRLGTRGIPPSFLPPTKVIEWTFFNN